MKKVVSGLFFLIAGLVVYGQDVPCGLSEVHDASGVVLKGEKNYINSEYKEMKLCLQFQYATEHLCLAISTNGSEALDIDSTNVAYVQLDNGKEYILKPQIESLTVRKNFSECRYLVEKQDAEAFANHLITGIYLSTKKYPQIDINDLNRYTARKLKEKFSCVYGNVINKK